MVRLHPVGQPSEINFQGNRSHFGNMLTYSKGWKVVIDRPPDNGIWLSATIACLKLLVRVGEMAFFGGFVCRCRERTHYHGYLYYNEVKTSLEVGRTLAGLRPTLIKLTACGLEAGRAWVEDLEDITYGWDEEGLLPDHDDDDIVQHPYEPTAISLLDEDGEEIARIIDFDSLNINETE